ncbi:MAG TPA: nucleotidyltransferase domain-containing protein [Chitinophagales bacterium]|jgi:predicted nucleotidyltransferase|nr:nucleotidyltransferase domain-containing protein [Chitinophagales bacterium]MBP6155173.1 nucleotidyltransferase domain-containing protein [Chitinophagales bacterium]HQV78388.1 nucleotidyltransferase domain-containing protein [Chitinophagales bacterium]HQW79539.1 nucleotidyltransferase domain-containing protein [Chitinophagales bacterium]HRB66516.1 nucleotidyltransferase domain-containing protein [Chitinophagales bacterium]
MQTIITDNIKAIQHICKQHHVKEMSVFGSVTKDDFNENSDVDVVIEFKEDINLNDYASNYFSFENSLKSLLNKNIDLVTKRFIENPYFLKAIQKNQQIIYVA